MITFTCPCCQAVTRNPHDIAAGYCGRCHWWTGEPGLASFHFALSCEHRGQGIPVAQLPDWYRTTRSIVIPDKRAAAAAPNPFAIAQVQLPRLGAYISETRLIIRDPREPWLHTMPGTQLELAGIMRRRPLPWWRRLSWRRHLASIRDLLKRLP